MLSTMKTAETEVKLINGSLAYFIDLQEKEGRVEVRSSNNWSCGGNWNIPKSYGIFNEKFQLVCFYYLQQILFNNLLTLETKAR